MKLSLQDVVKRFGTHTVLDRISLELDGVHVTWLEHVTDAQYGEAIAT